MCIILDLGENVNRNVNKKFFVWCFYSNFMNM